MTPDASHRNARLTTPVSLAKFIFEQGPLTPTELQLWPETKLRDYGEIMATWIRQNSPEAFLEQRELLRELAIGNILEERAIL